MIELSPRLKMAAEYARQGMISADIGTDHAYLPAYLVLNKISKKALAYDVRKGPILNAQKTIEKYNLSELIETGLSDGLSNIRPGSFDDLFICGMGGNLISNILTSAPWIKNNKYRLILQPQSHSEDVRKYLITNGFEIISENFCIDDNKLYNVICAEYTGIIKDYKVSYIYTGPDCKISKKYQKQYLMNVYKRLSIKREAAINYNTQYSYSELNEILSEIEELL